jgi:hypothetical protein
MTYKSSKNFVTLQHWSLSDSLVSLLMGKTAFVGMTGGGDNMEENSERQGAKSAFFLSGFLKVAAYFFSQYFTP